jgi:hypothetical protein
MLVQTLTILPGETEMFVMDMIDTPQDNPPVIVVSQAEQNQYVAEAPERTIGVCYVVDKRAEENLARQTGLYPWSDISRYFRNIEKSVINRDYGTEGHHDDVSGVTVLQNPSHGTLVLSKKGRDPDNDRFYYYQAEAGYHGMDKAIILGEVNGHKVEIHYFIHVVESRVFNMPEICGEDGLYWGISQYIDGLLPGMEGIAPRLNVTFDNLDNASLGEADGEGLWREFGTNQSDDSSHCNGPVVKVGHW